VSLALLAADDVAYSAGVVFSRLLFPLVGVVLIVLGVRRRRDPSSGSRGTVLIVAGVVLLALLALTAIRILANAVGTGV